MSVQECPICMDCIDNDKNKVITDCGHCFHTSCLMQNAAHNGFGCPYCRQTLASTPESDTEYDSEEDDDDDNSEDDGSLYNDEETNEIEEEYRLLGMRWLFQRANGEELEVDEDEVEDETNINVVVPDISPQLIAESLISSGYTMLDLTKILLTMNGDLLNRKAEQNVDTVFRHIRELNRREEEKKERNQERIAMSLEDIAITN